MSYRPILGIPRLTQDWGDEQHERETHWTSLFYDLMVVAALNAIAEPFEEAEEEASSSLDNTDFNGDGAFALTPIHYIWLDALLQFVSVVNPWNALNEFTSMFEDESFLGHISFFVHAFGLAATTAGCVGELSENYKVLATGIILAKIGLLVLYARPIIFVKRARRHMLVRAGSHVVNIGLMLWGMCQPYETFRFILIAATVWDWASLTFLLGIKREHRIPMHIESYADRIKEVTMVIFGEAIFAIILQPYSKAQPETHFYLGLAATLWMIYSMALQEFHIVPDEEDHALRRSVLFGFLWYYTQFFKQFFLLGTSIGLKRAHLLMFRAPLEPIDTDTRRLIVWGLSMTMLGTTMLRSYSFGFGRHPSKHDPPELYRVKTLWWTAMVAGVLAPQLVDHTLFEHYSSTPLFVLVTLGCVMSTIIMVEAAMSNLTAAHIRALIFKQNGGSGGGHPDELTYIRSSDHYVTTNYSSEDDNAQATDSAIPPKQPTAFLRAHCPTNEAK